MDRLDRMQQWAAGQYASQYGNNPWIQAMMKFLRGLKGNYGSSASGWGGGTLNAGQQAQAPAPKPPAQHGQPPGNSDGRQIGSPQSDNSIRPRPGIVRDPSAPGGDSVQYTMPAYTIGYVGQGKGNMDYIGNSQINGDYGWIPITPIGHIAWDSVPGPMQPQMQPLQQQQQQQPQQQWQQPQQQQGQQQQGQQQQGQPFAGMDQVREGIKTAPYMTTFGPENILRVGSVPGVIGNVYPQGMVDYMMSNKPNSSGQGQGV